MQLLLSRVFPCWQKGRIWGRKKKREVSHQGLLLLLFWIFILLLQWSQLDLFLRNSRYLSRGTKTAWVFFRNFSYWCALNTVVYRSFALCVKPEIPCFDTCVLCKNVLQVFCSKQKQKVHWTAIICAIYELISTSYTDSFSKMCLRFATKSTSADLVWNRIDQLNVCILVFVSKRERL